MKSHAHQFSEISDVIPRGNDRGELQAIIRRLLDGAQSSWSISVSHPWTYVMCRHTPTPSQGWKIHVSATPTSAPRVLETVAPVLLEAGCSFKFASTLSAVSALNGASMSRLASGKFITAYPPDGERCRVLLDRLHRATLGLHGPRILTDRPYAKGSIVHYRYGAFRPQIQYDLDGQRVHCLVNPEGQLEPDTRQIGVYHPRWVTPLFQEVQDTSDAVRPITLGGNYQIERAIRFTNKGGIYAGRCVTSGLRVIIKEARPYVAEDEFGRDARVRLMNEAAVLRSLEYTALTPKVFDVIEVDGHVFLVEEYIEGVTLRRAVSQASLKEEQVLGLLQILAQSVEMVHTAGWVLRDLNPNNILISLDGPSKVRLIDLELAAPVDRSERALGGWTYAYASPGQIRGEPPVPADDYYSLGATAAFVGTGRDPLNLPVFWGMNDEDALRQLRALLAPRLPKSANCVARVVIECTREDPKSRIPPHRVVSHLRCAKSRRGRTALAESERDEGMADLGDVISGMVTYLRRTVNSSAQSDRLWPVSCGALSTHPNNIMNGHAGVVLFLCEALRVGNSAGARGLLTAAVQRLQEPLREQLPRSLFYGRAGVALALLEAARALGDGALAERAAGILADVTPIGEPQLLDVTHGLAGVGLALISVWLHCREGKLLSHALSIADFLCEQALPVPGGLIWRNPVEVRSRMAGTSFFGFAHGSAGISHFLNCVWRATGRTRYLRVACGAMDALLDHVSHRGGERVWPWSPDGPGPGWSHYWCHGAGGIGATLIRLYASTGRERYLRAARACAYDVYVKRFVHSTVFCHGIAGNGELVMDMYRYTGDESYHAMARDMARAILLQGVVREGVLVVPDESGIKVSSDFGTGLAGVGAFLCRLKESGPRLLMVDGLWQ